MTLTSAGKTGRSSSNRSGAVVADTDRVTVEVQCEACGFVYELAGVQALDDGVNVACRECGGGLVEVAGELLVDGSAGLLVDEEEWREVPVDPALLVGLIDGAGPVWGVA